MGKDEEVKGIEKRDLEDDPDALYALPLAEFIAARNALAATVSSTGKTYRTWRT